MDSICIKLKSEKVPNIDLLAEVPAHLSNLSQHNFDSGTVIAGKLGNLKVIVNERQIKIENSLCKWYLNDNLKVMGRSDIKVAFEKMSDLLHLPIDQADVIGFHYPKNLYLKYDVGLYMSCLGSLNHYNRLEQPHGLNYKGAGKELTFYNKIREMRHCRELIPPLYQGKHVGRLEMRHKNGLCKYFNRPAINVSTLYDEAFYMQVNDDLHQVYLSISKERKYKTDLDMIQTKEQYKLMGVLALVKLQGGEMEALNNINERLKKGLLTKKQAHDQRKLIRACCKHTLMTVENDLMIEMDQKMNEAFKFYR